MRIFLSFPFSEEDRWVRDCVQPLLEAMGHNVITGDGVGGGQLNDTVKNLIASSQWFIAINTASRKEGHRWIQAELQHANALSKRALLVQDRAAQSLAEFVQAHIRIDYSDRAVMMSQLAMTVAAWTKDFEFNDLPNKDLGFSNTLSNVQQTLAKAKALLLGSEATEHPLRFDLTDECVNAYAEALRHTSERFWVTVYFNSGFWQAPPPAAVEANDELCKRLGDPKNLRRLFLLTLPIEQEVARRKDQMLARLRRDGQSERGRELELLKDIQGHIESQRKGGFEIRITHDQNMLYERLKLSTFTAEDTELAIFDRRRVDVYAGGKVGRMQSAHCYTKYTNNFDGLLTLAETYFTSLWDKAEDIDVFLKDLRSALDDTRKYVEYNPMWLAQFELNLDKDDDSLKTAEQIRVLEILRKDGRLARLNRTLDIGTCTARYPITLLRECGNELPVGARFTGCDNDEDCMRFASALVSRSPNSTQIEILRADFIATSGVDSSGPYDLILCMLGTLSHFGSDRNDAKDDELQKCLTKMSSLLADDGLLLIGQWSDQAIQTRQLLKIYEDDAIENLASWTCSRAELEQRLALAGFDSNVHLMHTRLQLYECTKVPRVAVSVPPAS